MPILTPCRIPGCSYLVKRQERYCQKHTRIDEPSFRKRLDDKKTQEQKSFYSGAKWTETSKRHRINEPLCRQCKQRGVIVPGNLVHHEPDRETLIARGDSPYDDRFLVTLCNNCHLAELRAKRNRPRG